MFRPFVWFFGVFAAALAVGGLAFLADGLGFRAIVKICVGLEILLFVMALIIVMFGISTTITRGPGQVAEFLRRLGKAIRKRFAS